jgi:choline dehydrogenase-like flavoprotein
MAKYELKDDSVVVIIGSGAGGGANELCQKGVKVVLLEAGKRVEIKDFVNEEWPMFNKIAWLDKHTTSGSWRVAQNFPELTCVDRKGGGRDHCPPGLGPPYALKNMNLRLGQPMARRWRKPARLALTLTELEPYYDRAEDKMGDWNPWHPSFAWQQQLQSAGCWRSTSGLQKSAYRQHGD